MEAAVDMVEVDVGGKKVTLENSAFTLIKGDHNCSKRHKVTFKPTLNAAGEIKVHSKERLKSIFRELNKNS